MLIPPGDGGDKTAADLRREAAALRELLNEQARLHARGVIDGLQLAAGSAELGPGSGRPRESSAPWRPPLPWSASPGGRTRPRYGRAWIWGGSVLSCGRRQP